VCLAAADVAGEESVGYLDDSQGRPLDMLSGNSGGDRIRYKKCERRIRDSSIEDGTALLYTRLGT